MARLAREGVTDFIKEMVAARRVEASEERPKPPPKIKIMEMAGFGRSADVASAEYRRRVSVLRTAICAVVVVVVMGRGGGLWDMGARLTSSRAAGGDEPCGPGEGGSVACRYEGSAFLAVAGIRDYFEKVGVTERAALTTYLPEAYTVTFRPSLLGRRAGGNVAFAIYLPMNNKALERSPHDQLYNDDINLNGTFATLLAVAAWDGRLLAATMATDLDGRGMTRVDAVKLRAAKG